MQTRSRRDLTWLCAILLFASGLGWLSHRPARENPPTLRCPETHWLPFHDEGTCDHDCCKRATRRFGGCSC